MAPSDQDERQDHEEKKEKALGMMKDEAEGVPNLTLALKGPITHQEEDEKTEPPSPRVE